MAKRNDITFFALVASLILFSISFVSAASSPIQCGNDGQTGPYCVGIESSISSSAGYTFNVAANVTDGGCQMAGKTNEGLWYLDGLLVTTDVCSQCIATCAVGGNFYHNSCAEGLPPSGFNSNINLGPIVLSYYTGDPAMPPGYVNPFPFISCNQDHGGPSDCPNSYKNVSFKKSFTFTTPGVHSVYLTYYVSKADCGKTGLRGFISPTITLDTSSIPVTPKCSSNSDCGTDGFTGDKFCSGGNVVQNYLTFTCNNPGTSQSSCSNSTSQKVIQECTNGCSNGQCNPEPVVCSINSDCGTDGFVGEKSCYGNNVTQNFRSFTCNNAGTNLSSCSNSTTQRVVQTCSNGCSNGDCNPGIITCNSNSDCGTPRCAGGGNFCLNGSVYQTFIFFTCNDAGTVFSFCSNYTAPNLIQSCSNGCSNGDCNPENIACSSNGDCGTDGFTGDKFCFGNNSAQNYLAFTCNDAGTSQSSCSNTATPRVVQNCSNGCSNGSCTNQSGVDLFIDGGYLPGGFLCENNQDQTVRFELNTVGNLTNTVMVNSFIDNNLYQFDFPFASSTGAVDWGIGFGNSLDEGSHNLTIVTDPMNMIVETNESNNVFLFLFNVLPENDSRCMNNTIICTSNSDCGTDGFTGNKFCSGNNVVQNYLAFTCNDAGTNLSSCSNSTSVKTVQECSNGCSNGQCNSHGGGGGGSHFSAGIPSTIETNANSISFGGSQQNVTTVYLAPSQSQLNLNANKTTTPTIFSIPLWLVILLIVLVILAALLVIWASMR